MEVQEPVHSSRQRDEDVIIYMCKYVYNIIHNNNNNVDIIAYKYCCKMYM